MHFNVAHARKLVTLHGSIESIDSDNYLVKETWTNWFSSGISLSDPRTWTEPISTRRPHREMSHWRVSAALCGNNGISHTAALAEPDHNAHCPQMSPRISFSNDFGDAQQIIKQERSSREAPISSDFEFSVTNYSMMSADELFSKGRLLPFRDNCNNQMQRTLRDELMVGEEDEVSARPPKGYATRWKGLLGLKKSHGYGSKKGDKNYDGSVDSFTEGKRLSSVQEEPYKTSQETGNGEGPSCRNEGMTRL